MADGTVDVLISVDGKDVGKAVKDIEGLGTSSNKAAGSVVKMAASFALVKVASAAFDVLKSSMDAAISRFDTMQKYPKVMGALGFSAKESSESVNKLADGIDGLPTKLDEVVSTTQRMTSVTGNLNKSTNATIALNNAMLASGASTADASRGMDQYIQMLSTGEVDLQSWKTLQETMPIGLTKTAEAMGFVGDTAQRDLYAALKSGTVTFDEFQNKLIELGTGTGVLADLAKTNSAGIATSFSNLKNVASVGLASIITSFNELTEEVTGKTIAENLDSLKVIVKAVFASINKAIQSSVPFVILFVNTLKAVGTTAKALSPVLIGLAASIAAFKAISSINSLFVKMDTVFQTAALSGKALTIVTKSHLVSQIADTTATKADIVAKGAQNGMVTFGTALMGVFTKSISLSTVAQTIATAATTAFGTALKVLAGPVGWVVLGIGALVTAGTALFKWFNKASAESKKLNAEQEKLKTSTDSLTTSVKDEAANRQDSIKSTRNSTVAYQKLADEVTELAAKEKMTAGEKKLLQANIETLNQSVDDLGLAYDKETGKLSIGTEMMKERIAAQGEQATANVAQEELVAILERQNEVESKLKETNTLREEWNQKLADGSVKGREARTAIEELDTQEKALKATQAELATAYTETKAVMVESTNAVAEATESGTFRQIISYESLSEAQKTAVDGMKSKWQEYSDAATEMFDVLSDKQTVSVAQMTANMEENQRVIGQWADNIAILAERGVDQGLLEKLREAGPSSAGHVAAMVNSSDTELSKMSEVFGRGGKTAMDSLSTAFNFEGSGVDINVRALAMGAKSTLSSSIKEADFGSIGKNVPQGLAEGIKGSSKEAETASKDMAKKTADSSKQELGIHSPSRVFKEFGTFIAQGLQQGIITGTPVVKSAMTALNNMVKQSMQQTVASVRTTSNQIPQALSHVPGAMQAIGAQIMYGLANGINSGSGAAISAANSVANQVKSTIQRAMDIHSPSRWMRDFIGKNMMLGWGDGIEGNSRYATKAMSDVFNLLSNGKLNPESALGLGRAFSMSTATNNYFTTNNNTSGGRVNAVDVHVHAKIGKRELVEEIAQPVRVYLDRQDNINNYLVGDV